MIRLARHPQKTIRPTHRQRGAAAILAMMFLVIFSALAAAMAVVSEGNLKVADTHHRATVAQASAETGMAFVIHHLQQAAAKTTTRIGLIDTTNVDSIWTQYQQHLMTQLADVTVETVGVNQIELLNVVFAPEAPAFSAIITREPGSTTVHVRVVSTDTRQTAPITRSVQMDFKIEKKIRYAILSKNRVMIGKNVMIEGPIGSRFMETNLNNGHPIQMESDFFGLDSDTGPNGLDAKLKVFHNTLATNDTNGDNRIDLASAMETADIDNPAQYDTNKDGYIDDYDFFLQKFDANNDGKISTSELNTSSHINRQQLFAMMDSRGGYARDADGNILKDAQGRYIHQGDGFIDNDDVYAKIRGEVSITATMDSWNNGAAKTNAGQPGQYQDFFQGPIVAGYQEQPLTFGDDSSVAQFGPEDFDVQQFKEMATGDLEAQASQQIDNDNTSADAPARSQVANEAVPYGSAHPYDYYNRPVYRNMTFKNVTIPKGTNALFENCTFIGVTFVETEVNNTDPNYNYNGMVDETGQLKHADKGITVGNETIAGNDPDRSSKDLGNNIRFDNCNFEGAVITEAPSSYTQVRNKLNFTGDTQFADLTSPAATPNLTQAERDLFRRSTILAPHMSVEMGTFAGVNNTDIQVHLSGTIVAGVIDMRGNIKVDGTLLTTFEPKSNEGPVIGNTSPNFNTTLGYFSKASGDLEAELPPGGIGMIRLRYDPTLPLPDGILAPIALTPDRKTYVEGGDQ